MAQKRRPQQPRQNRRPVPTECVFCVGKKIPSYRDWAELERFLTDRRKILGRSRTGVCARHQRTLTREIKRARHLALLPFTASIR